MPPALAAQGANSSTATAHWFSPAACLVRRELTRDDLAVLFVDRAALHDELNALKLGDVCQRIPIHRDNVRIAAGPDGADVLCIANEICGGTGGCDDRVPRRHARLHHERELLCILT